MNYTAASNRCLAPARRASEVDYKIREVGTVNLTTEITLKDLLQRHARDLLRRRHPDRGLTQIPSS